MAEHSPIIASPAKLAGIIPAWYSMHLSPQHQVDLLNLARSTIRSLMSQDIPPQLPADPELLQPAGCFVSLHELKTHRLRGCIGRLDATASLALVVRAMADSVLHDPRFVNDPVRLDELGNLEIELSIIGPLHPASDPLDFDLQNDGIYLSSLNRTGCFLPQVARETGWSKEQLLERLCTEKLGLRANAWRSPEARLEKFQTVVIGPEPFEAQSGSGAGHP